MIGKAIGLGFITARDFLARGLIKLRVTPNMLTLLGAVLTISAGVCYAIGAGRRFALSFNPHAAANAYLAAGGALLILASACDMLDGAVARIGKLDSRFGAFLDSTLDRLSDFVIFAGIAIHYAVVGKANLTFILLSMVAFFNAFMISYAKARAEDIIGNLHAGYWQRGERSAALLIGTFAYNIPAMVLQQAILPALTVYRRIIFTKHVIDGKPEPANVRQAGWWLKIRLWRWPRMTWAYDLVTGINIAWLIFAPVPASDLLGKWLGLT